MMPALTVWQPWATLIAEGCKPYEFRRWQAPRRLWGQRIAIHAAARPVKQKDLLDLIHRTTIDHGRGQALDMHPTIKLLERARADLSILPMSAVVCTAILGEPLPPDEVRRRWANDSDRDEHFSWAWPMQDVRPLAPVVPAKGAQGFWTWRQQDG